MRRWIALILALLMTVSLAGCGRNTEEELLPQGGSAIQIPSGETENTVTDPSGDVTTNTEQTTAVTDTTTAAEQTTTAQTASQETTATQQNQTEDRSVVDIANDLRYFGRVYEKGGTYYFNWIASGFEFSFTGTGVSATFESHNNYNDSASHTPYLKVYIDGKEAKRDIAVTDSMQEVVLCEKLKKGTHTVRVVKRTNPRSSSVGLMDITLHKGGVIETPPSAKTRKIEFLGDSITVGYGVLGNASTTEWSTSTEDGTKTYAALAAQALNAEYNVIAVSGRGLVNNVGGDEKVMGVMYPQTDIYNLAGDKWDFSKYQPDVVVVNLGTNDHSRSSEAEVKNAAAALLKDIRKNNPNAYIIAAYGMMGNKWSGAWQSTIKGLGDSKISFIELTKGGTVLSHPDAAAHKANAALLEAEIRRVTGWKN